MHVCVRGAGEGVSYQGKFTGGLNQALYAMLTVLITWYPPLGSSLLRLTTIICLAACMLTCTRTLLPMN